MKYRAGSGGRGVGRGLCSREQRLGVEKEGWGMDCEVVGRGWEWKNRGREWIVE